LFIKKGSLKSKAGWDFFCIKMLLRKEALNGFYFG